MIHPAPRNGREATPHWKAARRGVLLLPFGPASAPVWPPGAGALDWRECGGDGVVASFSVVRRPLTPEWKERAPYCVAFVDLPSGHRLFANLVDCDADQVAIGMAVTCAFVETDDPELGLVVFRPNGPGAVQRSATARPSLGMRGEG